MKPEPIDSQSTTLSASASFDELQSRIKDLEAGLESHGLRLSGAARLPEYRRVLRQATEVGDSIAETSPLMETVHRALLECHEHLLIVSELSRQPPVPGWRERMQTALGGRTLPSEEGARTPGRDAQYELLLAAYLRRAGYTIVLAEPDVRARLNETDFGVAAKRPKSEGGLEKAIRKGNEQILGSGVVGILAVDMSFLCDQPHKRMQVGTAENGRRHLRTLLDQAVDYRLGWLRNLVDPQRTFGLLASLTRLYGVEESQKLWVQTHWTLLNFCEYDDPLRGILRQVQEQLSKVAIL
jgi:hypothetical protein